MWLLLLGMNSAPSANVRWSHINYSPDCFFFSGPKNLGRDDHLGEIAWVSIESKRVVDFGTARFEGPLANTKISRTSTHDFGGLWTVVETFDGTWGTQAFNGHYLYKEQESGDTTGECTITAQVVIHF